MDIRSSVPPPDACLAPSSHPFAPVGPSAPPLDTHLYPSAVAQGPQIHAQPCHGVLYPPDDLTDQVFSMQLFVDPVIAEDGFTYERSSIEAWFR
jgi:hypothetical protein